MTEVAQYQPSTPATIAPAPGSTGANLIREAAAVMVDAHTLAKAVCNTQMIPKHFQGKPDELAAAMLYGASLNLDPMQSARQIYVVHGQAALYARAMDALVKGAGHETWTVESTDQSVTVAGHRKGSQHVEQATWTIERAKKAGYTSNEKYRTDPQAMLYAKALSEVCRKIAPDVLNGVYSVEELQMERWDDRPATTVTQVPASGADRMRGILNPQTDAGGEAAPGATGDDVAASSAPPASQHDAGSITKAQLTKLHTALSKVSLTDRDEALAYYARITGRAVESSKDLSKWEAGQVIDDLERAEKGEPNALDQQPPAPADEHDPTTEPGWGEGK